MQKYGLAISTYFNKKIPDARLDSFKTSITSILSSNFDGLIFLVDDGSETTTHLEWVESLNDARIVVVIKSENGGYSKVKNTGLRLLLEAECDYLFLADDDLIYKDKDWFKFYVDALQNSGIGHMNFYDHSYVGFDGFFGNCITVNKVALRTTNMVQGGLIILTRAVVESEGYFKILPEKLGHEHSQYSIKLRTKGVVPGFVDLLNSNDLLGYADSTGAVTTRPEDFCRMAGVNGAYLNSDFDIVEDCIE